MKAATNQIYTAEELGGAELHSYRSGVTDYLAENDTHALILTRRIVSNMKAPYRSSLFFLLPYCCMILFLSFF